MKKNENKWAAVVSQRPYISGLLVICLILLIYLPALDIYLRGDDFEWLNESYGAWENPAVLFHKINHFFRPLIKLSYLLNYTFFNTQVPFYNLTNILIHLLNVFLLYILIFRITRKNHIAFLTTLAYGTSPIYSEAVLWSAARIDPVLSVFMLSVLLLYDRDDGKISIARHLFILLLTLCALGAKETWMLLPFLVLSFLLIVKKIPLKIAMRTTCPLFVLLGLYIGFFLLLPLLSGSAAAPTAYANLGITAAVKKFTFLIFEYLGLTAVFLGAFWQYAVVFLLLTGLVYRLIRTKNRVALWGLTWMLITMSISLPIAFAPARYNYIPQIGFWIMVTTFLSGETGRLAGRFRVNRLALFLVPGIAIVLCLVLQVRGVRVEIDDYHKLGAPHRTIVSMYRQVKDKLPHDRPIIFDNLATRKAGREWIGKLKGVEKVLFVRERAIWELVYLSPLANFAGCPFAEILRPIPREHLEAVFLADYTILVFTDSGFFISKTGKPQLREYYRSHGKLPYKVEALRFVPVNNANK